MEAVVIPEYLTEGWFRIYDWMDETLLLRGHGSIYTGGDVDLIFWGVKYLELPLVLRGVRVHRPRDEEALRCEQKYAPNPFAEAGDRVYRVESEANRFNVIASNFWVLENKTHVSKSPLPYLTGQDEKLREGYFKEHVSQWYKVS